MTGPGGRSGLLVFSHGKESGPDSRKIQRLRPLAAAHGWAVAVPDHRGLDAPERVARLRGLLDEAPAGPLALVGSSMGGIVSVLAARTRPVAGLFLMAPAVYYPGYEHLDHRVETGLLHVVHGWRDGIIAPEAVIRFAREHRATLHLVDDDHLLAGESVRLERLFEDFLELLGRQRAGGGP